MDRDIEAEQIAIYKRLACAWLGFVLAFWWLVLRRALVWLLHAPMYRLWPLTRRAVWLLPEEVGHVLALRYLALVGNAEKLMGVRDHG